MTLGDKRNSEVTSRDSAGRGGQTSRHRSRGIRYHPAAKEVTDNDRLGKLECIRVVTASRAAGWGGGARGAGNEK